MKIRRGLGMGTCSCAARELGFQTEERSFEDIIRIHIEDELGGSFVT